jgi:hypothetical protein
MSWNRPFNRITIIVILAMIAMTATTSCKKETLHLLEYKVEIYENPAWYDVERFDWQIGFSHTHEDEPVQWFSSGTGVSEWKYEYYGLKKGEEVSFTAVGGYFYRMSVSIDGMEVSSTIIDRVSTGIDWVAGTVESVTGLNTSDEVGKIIFTYE